MRKLLVYILALFMTAGVAPAAMFGDFLVADALRPSASPTPGHNSRTAILIPLSTGGDVVVYVPDSGQVAYGETVLASIAMNLDSNRDVVSYSLGGRPWFGTRAAMADNVVFYNGYTHRNGVLYQFGFSLNTMAVPNEEVKRILSRIWLVPNLPMNLPPAIASAMDAMEMGEFSQAESMLAQAGVSGSGIWLLPFLRGKLAEMQEDLTAAATHYQQARSLYQDDVEIAARLQGMAGLSGSTDQAIAALAQLGESNPDEAIVWEVLGKIYLAAGEFDAAKDYFDEAAAVNPSSETALYNLTFILAEQQQYEEAFRRARQFAFYRPWMPRGVVPDVSGAPGLGYDKIQQILAEPLPLGYIEDYANLTAIAPSPIEIEEESTVLFIEAPTPSHTTIIYENYSPVVLYTWAWSPYYHRRPGSWIFGGFNRPWWNRPPAHRPRPPSWRPPPNRPGQGGNRPEQGGNRPGRPDPGRPRPPEGNRPDPGRPRPPEGGGTRPPSGGGERPRPPERPNIDVQPELPTPERPTVRPTPPTRPGDLTRPALPTERPTTRPTPAERPTTSPTPIERPTTRPAPVERPTIRPTPSERPTTRPVQPERPTTRPVQPERPAVTRPAPSAPREELTRPAPAPGRPPEVTRPAPRPVQPQARPATPPAQQPQAARPQARPQPSRPAPAAPAARPARQPQVQTRERPTRVEQPAAQTQEKPDTGRLQRQASRRQR